MWDLVEGGCVAKLDSGVGRGPVHSLAPHPTKPQLLTAAQGTVVIWDVDKGDDEEEMEVEPTLSSSSGTQIYSYLILSSILTVNRIRQNIAISKESGTLSLQVVQRPSHARAQMTHLAARVQLISNLRINFASLKRFCKCRDQLSPLL